MKTNRAIQTPQGSIAEHCRTVFTILLRLQRPTSIQITLLGLFLIISWQSLIMVGRDGAWTYWFCAGDRFPPPPYLGGNLYSFPNSFGFDGQFYLYIAHDLLNRDSTHRYVDNPPLRWRRILIPLSAWTLALGNREWIPASYIVVIWMLAAFGIYGLARLAECWRHPACLGLLFLTIPVVGVSLDRMMTDIAVVTFLFWVVLGAELHRNSWSYSALALVPLARETGLAITAGWIIWHIWRRNWKRAIYGAATALPSVSWWAWVSTRFDSDETAFALVGLPFSAVVKRLTIWHIHPADGAIAEVILGMEYLGAIGVALSFAVAIFLFVRGERSFLVFTAVVYTLGIACFTKEDMWSEAYSYTRTAGPVAVMLTLIGLQTRRWWLMQPMYLSLPRIATQYYSVGLFSYLSFPECLLRAALLWGHSPSRELLSLETLGSSKHFRRWWLFTFTQVLIAQRWRMWRRFII